MNTVLILGANGRMGQAATQAFSAAGWRVLAQMRRASTALLPLHASALLCSLADTDNISKAASGASVVLHAVNPPYHRWEREALPALQQGMAAAQRLGALFMLPGNVYNFGAKCRPCCAHPHRNGRRPGRGASAWPWKLRCKTLQCRACAAW